MIKNFTEHAANERTFLAWVRTGVAIIALGFVIEKFNLFLVMLATSAPDRAIRHSQMERLGGPLGRYGGLALVFGGLLLILTSGLRFLLTERRLDDPSRFHSHAARLELLLLTTLVTFVAVLSLYLAIE